MFPYRCETFTTANVSVLNVFKTSVDTINASSITSDMTIGANLNGGSLTLGSAGATNLFLRGSEVKINEAGGGTVFIGNTTSGSTDINSKITNIGTFGLPATGRVNIGTGTNVYGAEIKIGSSTMTKSTISAGEVKLDSNNIIIGSALSGNGVIDIAAYADTTTGYLALGSRNLDSTYMKAKNIFINHDGGNVIMGTSTSGSTNIIGNVALGANALTDPTAASTNITLGTANSVFRLYTPITISYPGINYNMNTIGGQYTYFQAYNRTFPSATRSAFGCTPLLPIGVYALSGFINFGGIGQGTTGFINLVTANSTVSDGATSGFSEADPHLFYNERTWPGPGSGSTYVSASDIFVLGSPKCLALQVYITSPSNAGQSTVRFGVTRIG